MQLDHPTDLPVSAPLLPDTAILSAEPLRTDAGTFSSVPRESLTDVLGVVYVHRRTHDGGDLYLTQFGMRYAEQLDLHNWYERRWFEKNRVRLEGTSAVYRVPTRERRGISIDLVVKNCRVGEDVPVATRTLLEFMSAEFNSPWEEFSLVMELREGKHGPPDMTIRTQEPLAIYVPPERMQMWQSGRSVSKINRIKARHPGIEIDILRQYKLVYGWIRGLSLVEIFREMGLAGDDLRQALEPVTRKAIADLESKGYAVADMKPEHVIIGEVFVNALRAMSSETLKTDFIRSLLAHGEYSVIDYELMLRTPLHDEEVKYSRRHSYLDDQRDRFKATRVPPHLRLTEVMDVPYVWGVAESTGGQLWVVGRNARLFDYFLPERWRRTHSWKLSESSDVFYTVSKDNIHIVWKISRVGEKPPRGHGDPRADKLREFGYNSPFEECATAQFLNANGVPTVYMRAIYMTGAERTESSRDVRRYRTHRRILTPDGKRVLRRDHDYIIVRGYFNGPDEWVAAQKGQLCRPVDLQAALEKNLVDEGEFARLRDMVLQKLRNLNHDGSLLNPADLLLAVDPQGSLLRDARGEIEVRICNLELVKRM